MILLLAVSVTGLLLTVSYTWMRGNAYEFLAILHAITVIFTLLWLPFGKFFHVFVRPTHLAVGAYKDAGKEGEQAHCRRCDQPFASRMHVEDLITVERQLGYHYERPDRRSGITSGSAPPAAAPCWPWPRARSGDSRPSTGLDPEPPTNGHARVRARPPHRQEFTHGD